VYLRCASFKRKWQGDTDSIEVMYDETAIIEE
jgi:hypothetical protein